MINFKLYVALVFLITVGCLPGCKEIEGNDTLYLKIRNNTNAKITVISTANRGDKHFKGTEVSADFGSIAAGETSHYRMVSNAFSISINGTLFSNSSGLIKFVISNPPSTQWSLDVTSQTGVYTLKAD